MKKNIPYSTITGYLIRKGRDETNPDYYASGGSDQSWLELRYAEVLLNYAEAQNPDGTYTYERKPVDAVPCVFQDKI